LVIWWSDCSKNKISIFFYKKEKEKKKKKKDKDKGKEKKKDLSSWLGTFVIFCGSSRVTQRER
jgi:hypothetical protein